ncbi:hypothetical protein [Rhodococcus sp. ACS1]|uniref:hypothetical protein n=1 Tax=Rhodococcus sp. ACS1 TaxID=2028570 RepID=UPI00211C54A8|nr:hypothetical protein [Rhodococcus sp. ACS1]
MPARAGDVALHPDQRETHRLAFTVGAVFRRRGLPGELRLRVAAAAALFSAPGALCGGFWLRAGCGVGAARFAAIAAAHDGGNAPGATMAGSGSSKFGSNSAAISLSGCTVIGRTHLRSA